MSNQDDHIQYHWTCHLLDLHTFIIVKLDHDPMWAPSGHVVTCHASPRPRHYPWREWRAWPAGWPPMSVSARVRFYHHRMARPVTDSLLAKISAGHASNIWTQNTGMPWSRDGGMYVLIICLYLIFRHVSSWINSLWSEWSWAWQCDICCLSRGLVRATHCPLVCVCNV